MPKVDVVSIDISMAMSRLGQICIEHGRPRGSDHISFIAGDAHNIPFEASSFDGAVIFSGLHHFADSKRLLKSVSRILKEDGFIAIMCEPCMPNPDGADYLRDLAKGINEQCWAVEEYGEIFLASGMFVAAGQVDGGSLKVILKRPG